MLGISLLAQQEECEANLILGLHFISGVTSLGFRVILSLLKYSCDFDCIVQSFIPSCLSDIFSLDDSWQLQFKGVKVLEILPTTVSSLSPFYNL